MALGYVDRQNGEFSLVDYIVFAIFMVISLAVGVYFSIVGGRRRSTSEYNEGSRQMNPIPVGVSICVSFISALTIIGVPAEMYRYGHMYMFSIIGQLMGFLPFGLLVANVFHPMGIASPNEYLIRRYQSKVVALFGYVVSTLSTCLYMGVCMYGPALALSEASGGRMPVIGAFILGNAIGVIYTTLGGLKAVVWTDFIQAGFMLTSMIIVLVHSVIYTGGPAAVVEYNQRYDRLNSVDFSPDPRVRHTFWSTTALGWGMWATFATTPANVQRVASIPTLRNVRISYIVALPLLIFFTVIAMMTGLAIFGYYASLGCDVVAANWLSSANTVLPYYVINQIELPGFAGFMMAGIFAGSLSTQSSGLSALGVIVWRDVLKPYYCKDMEDRKATVLVMLMVVVFGVISTLFGYGAMTAGTLIIQTFTSLDSAFRAPYFAIFLVGILCPWANAYGAMAGGIGGFLIGVALNAANIVLGPDKNRPPTVTSNCSYINTTSLTSGLMNATVPDSIVEPQLRDFISYAWLLLLCCVASGIIIIVVSWITKSKSPPVDPECLWKPCRPRTEKAGKDEENEYEQKRAARQTTTL